MIIIQILVVFVCISALMYFLMTSVFLYGWLKMPEFEAGPDEENLTPVTVVVAARNEENNILTCLDALVKQGYPKALYEIIIVDDNSEDDTCKKCNDFILEGGHSNVKLIKLTDYNKISKKEAIKCGVEKASGRLIITTDADCRMGSRWVRTIVTFYEKNKFRLICGTVNYHKSKGLFQQFQLLDFLSMIISGAGAAGAHKPFIGNAANMAFEKMVFDEVNSNTHGTGFASGDDVFLMHKIKERYKKGIGFIKAKETIVSTEARKNLTELVLQRVRWASKSKGYNDIQALFFTLTVLEFNFWMVFVLFAGFFCHNFIFLYLALLAFKIVVDFPLIYSITRFNRRTDLLLHYVWVQLVYPFFIVISALFTVFMRRYEWKGRKYR